MNVVVGNWTENVGVEPPPIPEGEPVAYQQSLSFTASCDCGMDERPSMGRVMELHLDVHHAGAEERRGQKK